MKAVFWADKSSGEFGYEEATMTAAQLFWELTHRIGYDKANAIARKIFKKEKAKDEQ